MRIMIVALGAALVLCNPGTFSASAQAQGVREPRARVVITTPATPYWDSNIVPRYRYRPEDDRVIVPTESLFIEALVGTHPLLEDFKLIHRSLDVKKVQAETRHAELENVRLAARALRGNDEDPDIEKKIVIEGNGATVAMQPDG